MSELASNEVNLGLGGDGVKDRVIGSTMCSHGIKDSQLLESARVRAGLMTMRINNYEVDFGEGFSSVNPDPAGMIADFMRPRQMSQADLAEWWLSRTDGKPRVSGMLAHLPGCGRSGCGGCFRISGWRENVEAWLKDVPALFDRSAKAARVLAFDSKMLSGMTLVGVNDLEVIGVAKYDLGEVVDLALSRELPSKEDDCPCGVGETVAI